MVIRLKKCGQLTGSSRKCSDTKDHDNDAKYLLSSIVGAYVTISDGWKSGNNKVKGRKIAAFVIHLLILVIGKPGILTIQY